MTDREMLEAAARAGGYVVIRWTDDGTALLLEGVEQPWNALHETPHSDCMGDALRLAVRKRFHVNIFSAERLEGIESTGFVEIWREGDSDPIRIEYVEGGDYDAATRRAIVRAAAAIAALPAQQGEQK